MAAHALGGRTYGCRYDRTRTLRTLPALAQRIIADLSDNPRFALIPVGITLSIRIISGMLLCIEVGGLSDEFTFADYTDTKHSTPANALISRIMQFAETYNWINDEDSNDRRFVTSVRLLAEAEYRTIFWTPGQVRLG